MRAYLLLAGAVALSACGHSGDDQPDTLYARMGGEAGVRKIVDDMITSVKADERINGYFRNVSVDIDHMAACMVKQIGAATGGPQTYPDGDCRSMHEAHSGLGVSGQDMSDFVEDVTAVVNATDLSAADKTDLLAVFGGPHDDIVEDPNNNATVYQRVGRKPAISTVVTSFENKVVADTTVNGFFAGITDITRLHNCLTRMVCSIDGPCKYGEETPDEFPGLTNQTGCRDMMSSHYGLNSGAPDNRAITYADFQAIVTHLTAALNEAGVAPADRDAVLGVLGPLCPMIVGDNSCP